MASDGHILGEGIGHIIDKDLYDKFEKLCKNQNPKLKNCNFILPHIITELWKGYEEYLNDDNKASQILELLKNTNNFNQLKNKNYLEIIKYIIDISLYNPEYLDKNNIIRLNNIIKEICNSNDVCLKDNDIIRDILSILISIPQLNDNSIKRFVLTKKN